MNWFKAKLLRFNWLALSLSLLTSLFFIQKINLPTADLGRHLINGQLVWNQGLSSPIINTNYYSYTNPSFAFPNHHWLYGAIIWPIFQAFGFNGLTLLNVGLFFISSWLLFSQAGRHTKKTWLLIWFISLPLLTNRCEIRPESFSLLFVVLFQFLLNKFADRRLPGPALLIILVLIELIWVNLHLFFGLGILLIGYYLVKMLLLETRNKWFWRRAGWLGLALLVSTLTTLANPNGWRGALVPLTIFSQYQYPIAENQSTFFFFRYYPQLAFYWYYLGFSLLNLANLVLSWKKFKLKENLLQAILIVPLLAAGSLIIRLYPFVATLLFIPTAELLTKKLASLKISSQKIWRSNWFLGLVSPLIFALILVCAASGFFLPKLDGLGWGIESNSMLPAAKFLEKLPPTAHVFNNYDAGGYLIWSGLAQKVFIDNRPEFYPADFIQNEYIAAQENETDWQKIVEKYQLDTIFFYRHDATNWGQPFLIKRLQDSSWVPIYVDAYFIILVKDTAANQILIDQYRLPAEIFRYSSS